MMCWFGDLFCCQKRLTNSEWIRTIAFGDRSLGDLITPNMEALMLTILETGCNRDWENFRKSDKYKAWMAKAQERAAYPHRTNNPPVSDITGNVLCVWKVL